MTKRGAEAAQAPQKHTSRKSMVTSPESNSSEPGLPRMLTDRYRLERLIAKGGMGRVYLATQLPLERKVALKHLVRPSLNEDFRRRFFLEASVLARLSHPNIVVVHDYGEAPDGSLFMAMEYLDGFTLLDTLRREGRLTAVRACEIAHQVCRALRSSHKQGVAHRDLKPGNIMLLRDLEQEEEEIRRDIVKVLDFGLVKVFQEDEDQDVERDLTRAEMMLGSPRYMAPEQIQCTTVDARADVYSLGVVLFAMLTGRPPFVGTTLEILNQHLEARVPGLNELTQKLKGFNAVNPDIEPVFNGIISKCMEKNPFARYQSMDELLIELRSVYRLLTDDSLETPSLEFPRPSVNPSMTSGIRSILEQSSDSSSNVFASSPSIEQVNGFEISTFTGQPRKNRRNLIPFVVGGIIVAIAITLGVVTFDDSDAPEPITVGAHISPMQPATTPAKTVVSFSSNPSGAEVLLGKTILGTTPLQSEMEPGTAPEFLFRLDGYQPKKVTAPIQGESSIVHATLFANAPETDPVEPITEQESPVKIVRSDENRHSKRRRRPQQSTPQRREQETVPPPAVVEPTTSTKVPERPSRILVDEPRGAVPVVD